MDFGNLKPSDIISGAFASDGPKEKIGTQKSQQAQLEALKSAMEQGAIGIDVGACSDPIEALNVIQAGTMIFMKGFQVLKDTGKIDKAQVEQAVEAAKVIFGLWKEARATMHEAHKAEGNCTCPVKKSKRKKKEDKS